MNQRWMCLAALSIVPFTCGCGKPPQAAPPLAAERGISQHNSQEQFTAWVICIDTSRSPLPEEFARLKAVIREAVDTDIDFNDLVWIVRIGDQFHPARLFQMPPGGHTRLERERASGQLRTAKQEVLAEVDSLQQVTGTTDLKNPIELGLNVLANQRANGKFLVIGSDFIQDSRDGITCAPPKTTEGMTAKNVNVTLLLTYPSPRYLAGLGVSAAELNREVTQQWTNYFSGLGAARTVVELADAVPAHSGQP